jgi:hypothetical protein
MNGRTWGWIALLALVALAASCAGDGDDDAEGDVADDDLAGDDAGDDDRADDDSVDDDIADDDTGDARDIWVAPWPQSGAIEGDFDESVIAGPLRAKAIAYDAWHEAWHQPYYGSTVETVFADDARTIPVGYGGMGDSCIWTGTYLTSQAFRYRVTGDAQAKANVLRAQTALSNHLHVTGRPGFIARYRGPQDSLVFPPNCADSENCHVVTEGEFAGDFWEGNTSRDQYTGWFLGMATAYDLVDDEAMRAVIRADVTEVLDELIRTNFVITDVDGRRTTAGPTVIPTYRLAWYLIGYHLTGRGNFQRVVQDLIRDDSRRVLRLSAFAGMNHYSQHYGNNLNHQNAYTALRLARVYLGPEDYAFLQEVFETETHTFMRLAHNAFFTAIEMSQGTYVAAPGDPYQTQLEDDLTQFRPAPNSQFAMFPPETELDPVSVFLHDLFTKYPFLGDIFGGVNVQAKEAYPVSQQCFEDFLWQRNPWAIRCNEVDNPRVVAPGVDYLTAYWMASAHSFLRKGQ